MTDSTTRTVIPAAADAGVRADADTLRLRIEEIASDETMPVLDRQARLEALAAEWGVSNEAVSDEVATDPFRQQIARALALLAEGGHR